MIACFRGLDSGCCSRTELAVCSYNAAFRKPIRSLINGLILLTCLRTSEEKND